MPPMKWLPVLCLAALTACAQGPAEDSDTDDLSSSTLSMEMVRKNPALAPGVEVPHDVPVKGRARPLSQSDAREKGGVDGQGSLRLVGPSDWLYAANQLGQFSQLPDPAAFDKTDAKDASYSRQPGDLLSNDNKLDWLDVEQGYLGDCYFAASLAATLYADNGGALTKGLITPHTVSGKVVSYYVNFFQANGRKVRVEVDPDLLHRNSSGNVYYMRNTETKAGYEVWSTSLIEKAYAKWQGSYATIGNGGTAADAIHALTGKKTKYYDGTDAKVIPAIEAAQKAGKAMVACTYGDKSGVKYPVGIYADHCYTLRGLHRVGSNVFVMLRNPWGPGSASDAEPTEPPTDGVPDALFEIPQADFARLYATVDIVP